MKFYGIVGFYVGDVETAPGVWKQKILKKTYVGELKQNIRRWQTEDQQNEKLRVNNSITILSDLYARQNCNSIRYVIYNGIKFKVSSVTINYPRIILEIGGVYDGEDAPDTP